MKQMVTLLLLLSVVTTGFAQSISALEKDSVITNIKRQVNQHFVSIEKAKLIADSLQSAAFGAIHDKAGFVKQLNKRLYQLTHDKHLTVDFNPTFARQIAVKTDDRTDQETKEKQENYGFDKAQRLRDNVGYLKLHYFADTKNARATALKTILSIKETKALILDLRGNSGGSGSMVQLLTSVFLPGANTDILRIALGVSPDVDSGAQDAFELAKSLLWSSQNSRRYRLSCPDPATPE